ncbi:MAG: diacylglycerol kinase family lipid kinase [Chloroflexota bacterium]|nr:MAG: diacylglycerol kinase family lipid kinase [Chloroflexota bacterium]
MQARMIYNPTAGPRDVRRALKHVCSYLRRRGWSVELQLTKKPGDAIILARAAAQAGCDVVVVAGGDGTVNEAVNGLVGTRTALSVLPVGTGNMWAKQLGIPTYTLTNPLRLREAAVGLTEGIIRPVDVGQVDDRYFLCWAGIGLDAQVTTEMEPRQRRTKRLGVLPYAIAAVLVARDFQGVRTRVSLDGSIVRGRTLLILVSNIQQYIGILHIAHEARMDDGLLDVFIFKGLGFQYAVRHLLKIISRRYLQDPQIVHRQARHIEVWTEWAIPVQVDGDPIGTTPVTLKVVPSALRVLVPPSAPSGLFAPAV